MAEKVKQGTKTKTDSKAKTKVSALKEERPQAWLQELTEAWYAAENGYLDSARLLHEVYHHPDYLLALGYDDFKTFANTVGLNGIESRKAFYFVKIWDCVETCKINLEQARKLGWSKMKELARVMDPSNSKDWLKKAEKLTVEQLTEEVKITKGKTPGEPGVVMATLKVRMTHEASTAIADAITAYQDAREAADDKEISQADALLGIINEWREAQGDDVEPMELSQMIAWIERVYPVKVEIKSLDDIEEEPPAPVEEEEPEEIIEEEAPKKPAAKKPAAKKAPAKKAKEPEPEEDEDGEDDDMFFD